MRFIECPHCHRMGGISQRDATKRLFGILIILTVGLAALALPFALRRASASAFSCELCGWRWTVARPDAAPGVPVVALPGQHYLRHRRQEAQERRQRAEAGRRLVFPEPRPAASPVCSSCGRPIPALPTTIEEDIRSGGGTVVGSGLGETLYQGVICRPCRHILCYEGCFRQGSPCPRCGGPLSPLFADHLR